MTKCAILISTVLILSFNTLRGQADLCTGATLVTCGGTVNGTTTGFTADIAPFCTTSDGAGPGVWYRFNGNGQVVTASLCTSSFDTRIRVYSGACGALQCVAGNDDACGNRSRVTWSSQSGYTYFILVHGFGSSSGAFSLGISCAAPSPQCYSQTATVYAADPFTGTQLTLTDDVHSPVVPIGFPFCFNGLTYTHCVISSNNYISFNPGTAGTFSPWVTVAVPNAATTALHNSIMAPWQDIDPGVGGQVRYQTLGTPPNRRFVVSYLNVPMYACNTQLYSSQTVLYESSNCIGTFITTKPICATHNGGRAVHGVQTGNGGSASVVTGRNNSAWTSTMQGTYFTPTCAPCSTPTSGQCMPMVLPVELLHFSGHEEGGQVHLQWATANEVNTSHFVVERSEDLKTFAPIGSLDAAGNSQEELHYSLLDDRPAPGVNYYRLRSVDRDGSTSLSELLSLQITLDMRPLIYPNPAHELVHISVPDGLWEETTMVVRDVSGRVVRTLVLEGRVTRLTLAGFRPGAYILEMPSLGPAASSTFKVL